MLRRGSVPLVLRLAVAGPAMAEVKSGTVNGFEVATVGTIAAPADRVYAALGEVGRWWDPSHTFSRDAANLSIELRAGGCFCEAVEGWRLGSASAGCLRRAWPEAASARRARPVADGGRRRHAQLDAETGRGRHQCRPELCRRRLHPQRHGAMGDAGRSGARRAAATPEKLRRQIPATIASHTEAVRQ